jgi:hypothetical protein
MPQIKCRQNPPKLRHNSSQNLTRLQVAKQKATATKSRDGFFEIKTGLRALELVPEP